MKIIHSLGWYFPDQTGGSEVYVDALVKGLRSNDIDSIVTAPLDGNVEKSYHHDGISVYRYPVHLDKDGMQYSHRKPHGGFDKFLDWLSLQDADIYHQHSWTLGCGYHHLMAAKKAGFKIVLTAHVASMICVRGSMMLYGKHMCDGKIEEKRCGACWNQFRGLSLWGSHLMTAIPEGLRHTILNHSKGTRLGTLLRGPELIGEQRERMFKAFELSDTVVVPCRWLYDAFRINGVNEEKLFIVPAGCRGSRPDGIKKKRITKRACRGLCRPMGSQ